MGKIKTSFSVWEVKNKGYRTNLDLQGSQEASAAEAIKSLRRKKKMRGGGSWLCFEGLCPSKRNTQELNFWTKTGENVYNNLEYTHILRSWGGGVGGGGNLKIFFQLLIRI